MSTNLGPSASRSTRRAVPHPGTSNVPSSADRAFVRSAKPPSTSRWRADWDVWVLFAAMVIFYVLLLIVGRMSIVDAMPDLDLGSGISMTPDGQIKVTNEKPLGASRIPDEAEYNGITMP